MSTEYIVWDAFLRGYQRFSRQYMAQIYAENLAKQYRARVVCETKSLKKVVYIVDNTPTDCVDEKYFSEKLSDEMTMTYEKRKALQAIDMRRFR